MSTVINLLFWRASNMPRKDIPGRKSQNQLISDVFFLTHPWSQMTSLTKNISANWLPIWPTISENKSSISLSNIMWLKYFWHDVSHHIPMYCHNLKLCSDGFPSLLAATHPELEKHWLSLWNELDLFQLNRLILIILPSTTRHRVSVMPSLTCPKVRPSKLSESRLLLLLKVSRGCHR